tara:strand:- start:95 stop:322 length:228 start_codon:yes stop_codon:yes gene_type:complete
MPEPPIETSGIIREARSKRVYRVELVNGKSIVGHLPGRLADLASSLSPGVQVCLEMTPFDFEKGRIAGIAEHLDE